jgi:hypothetical protein
MSSTARKVRQRRHFKCMRARARNLRRPRIWFRGNHLVWFDESADFDEAMTRVWVIGNRINVALPNRYAK